MCALRVGRIAGGAQGGGLSALPEAVALAVHLQDVNAVSKAIQQGAGEVFRAENLGPLVEGQVGSDEDRPSLVSLAEDLEEELRVGLGEWDEAKLADDQQLEPCQLLLEVEQSSLVPGLDQLVDQRGGGGEADRQPPLAGGEPKPRATWVLPVPLLPMAMTFSRRSAYSHRTNCITRCLFTDGMARKSKVSRLLTAGKRAALILQSTMR